MSKKYLGIIFFMSVLSACTQPAERTQIGAAAGGVMGAGLGAIVGSQTGDAGSGMVIGALAGAGTGAAIGNAFDAQDQAIKTQDEAIERQQNLIAAQNAELSELRGMNRDSGTASERRINNYKAIPRIEKDTIDETPRAAIKRDAFVEKELPTKAYEKELPAAVKEQPRMDTTAKLDNPPATGGEGCTRAKDEADKASSAKETSDKLFHYRRALRLCPSVASYHNAIAQTYAGLGRGEDARFEYLETLKIDPANAEAKKRLKDLPKANSSERDGY